MEALKGIRQRDDFEEDSDEDKPEATIRETQEIPFPEIPEGSEYLVSLLHSAGTATQTGMGLVPLSWQEIEAWMRCNFISLTPWELQVIKRLSEAYASEYSHATDNRRKPPYEPKIEVEEIDREAVCNSIMSIFSQLRKK